MRVTAAKMAKETTEKGHTETGNLYETIISEYPEIEEEMKKYG